MTATCMGTFGTYQYMWSHNIRELSKVKPTECNSKSTVWITKRYIPTDLRVQAPVPRHKLIAPDVRDVPVPEKHWIPQPRNIPAKGHYANRLQKDIFPSSPSTRSEEWSTLRQMLPSRGRSHKVYPVNWGTGSSPPPSMSSHQQTYFPHINSPMTR